MNMTAERILQILLVDDHAPTREEIRILIEREIDMRVVGESGSGEEAVKDARRMQPDVVVMDINLPRMNGIEATRIISRELPLTRVVALSNHASRSLAQAILNAGGLGYVRKDRAFEELVGAIRATGSGRSFLGVHVGD